MKFMLKIHSVFNTLAANHSPFLAHNLESLQTHKAQYKSYAQVIFLAFHTPTPVSEYPWLEQLLQPHQILSFLLSIPMVSSHYKAAAQQDKKKVC